MKSQVVLLNTDIVAQAVRQAFLEQSWSVQLRFRLSNPIHPGSDPVTAWLYLPMRSVIRANITVDDLRPFYHQIGQKLHYLSTEGWRTTIVLEGLAYLGKNLPYPGRCPEYEIRATLLAHIDADTAVRLSIWILPHALACWLGRVLLPEEVAVVERYMRHYLQMVSDLQLFVWKPTSKAETLDPFLEELLERIRTGPIDQVRHSANQLLTWIPQLLSVPVPKQRTKLSVQLLPVEYNPNTHQLGDPYYLTVHGRDTDHPLLLRPTDTSVHTICGRVLIQPNVRVGLVTPRFLIVSQWRMDCRPFGWNWKTLVLDGHTLLAFAITASQPVGAAILTYRIRALPAEIEVLRQGSHSLRTFSNCDLPPNLLLSTGLAATHQNAELDELLESGSTVLPFPPWTSYARHRHIRITLGPAVVDITNHTDLQVMPDLDVRLRRGLMLVQERALRGISLLVRTSPSASEFFEVRSLPQLGLAWGANLVEPLGGNWWTLKWNSRMFQQFCAYYPGRTVADTIVWRWLEMVAHGGVATPYGRYLHRLEPDMVLELFGFREHQASSDRIPLVRSGMGIAEQDGLHIPAQIRVDVPYPMMGRMFHTELEQMRFWMQQDRTYFDLQMPLALALFNLIMEDTSYDIDHLQHPYKT